jgi:hypothetical protein
MENVKESGNDPMEAKMEILVFSAKKCGAANLTKVVKNFEHDLK